MNRQLEILQELISIGVIVSEPILVGTEYIYNIDVSHCTDGARLDILLNELMSLQKEV
jgi:hypothetical protein